MVCLAAACAPSAPAPTSDGGGATSASAPSPKAPAASPAQSPASSPAASPARPQTIVRLGRPESAISAWLISIADQQGFFSNESLSVRLEEMDTSGSLQALTAGRLDVALLPASAVVLAPSAADLAIVAGLVNRPIEGIVAGREFSSWTDLRGQAIAVRSTTDASAALAARVLEARGVRRGDVTFIGLEDEEARSASVVNGTAAAALLGLPAETRMIARGYRLLGRVVDAVPELQQDVVAVGRRWSQEGGNGDALVRFIRAIVRAEQWLRLPANRDAAVRSLGPAANLAPPDAQQAYDVIVRVNAIPGDGSVNRPGMTTVLDLVAPLAGPGRTLPPADRLVETSFLERASR